MQHWVSETDLRRDSAIYNPMSLNELSTIFSMVCVCILLYNYICMYVPTIFIQNWVNYFNNYFEKAGYSGNFNGSTVVIVETPSYFRGINRYLTRR